MIYHAYSIFDRKALVYHRPFFDVSDGSAVRSLSDNCNDPESAIGRHPGDYVLFRVGTYDDQKGELLPVSPLIHVADAIALVRQQTPLSLVKEG